MAKVLPYDVIWLIIINVLTGIVIAAEGKSQFLLVSRSVIICLQMFFFYDLTFLKPPEM